MLTVSRLSESGSVAVSQVENSSACGAPFERGDRHPRDAFHQQALIEHRPQRLQDAAAAPSEKYPDPSARTAP